MEDKATIFVYDEKGNRIGKHQVGTEEEIRKQYQNENIYISYENLGEEAIVENGNYREKTRVDLILEGTEKLEDGEYIEDNTIKYKKSLIILVFGITQKMNGSIKKNLK